MLLGEVCRGLLEILVGGIFDEALRVFAGDRRWGVRSHHLKREGILRARETRPGCGRGSLRKVEKNKW